MINLRPSSKAHGKPRPTGRREKENPTGLVTKLGGTIVKDGLTTVHETSVIGTYINGKYAQVLQSSSRILSATPPVQEGKIRPSSTQRILKTIGPQQGKLKPQLEPTPTHPQQEESSLPLEVLFSAPAGKIENFDKIFIIFSISLLSSFAFLIQSHQMTSCSRMKLLWHLNRMTSSTRAALCMNAWSSISG